MTFIMCAVIKRSKAILLLWVELSYVLIFGLQRDRQLEIISIRTLSTCINTTVPDCQFIFSHLGFWSRNFFLITPFPVHCLLFNL